MVTYQAKRKSNLSAHNRTIHHAEVGKAEMLECNVCLICNNHFSQIKSDEDKSIHQRIRF